MYITILADVSRVKQFWLLDAFRSIMWSIAKEVLLLLDGLFGIIDGIWRYKFFDNEYINKVFSGAIIVATSWLVLKVVLELIINYIIKNDDRGSPLKIFKGVVITITMIFLINPLFQFGHSFSTALTDAVIEVSGMGTSENESTISTALISVMINDNETAPEDKEYFVANWKTVDINATTGGVLGIGDTYLYSLNIFMLTIFAFVTVFLLFFLAIQMAKRIMEIALFKIIAPFCCTSLTNNNSKSFETWAKSTMGLFLITVVQFVSLGLLINMFGSSIKDNGTLTGIFLIIGALLFIISTPTIVSSLLGQQSGMMTAFGDIQSLMALGQGVTAGISVAKAGVMGALSGGARVAQWTANKGGNITSNMIKHSNLSNEQRGMIMDNLNKQNYRKAFDLARPNANSNSTNIINTFSKNNPINSINPLRNRYFSNTGLDARSKIERK